MDICVDYDGTCVTHEFPRIGRDIGAQRVLKKLVAEGHNLVLFTMRCDGYLAEAVDWFRDNEIELYGINVNPTQHRWTTSPKAEGQLYIDDAGLCTPLITPMVGRPYVDWVKVEEKLTERGIL